MYEHGWLSTFECPLLTCARASGSLSRAAFEYNGWNDYHVTADQKLHGADLVPRKVEPNQKSHFFLWGQLLTKLVLQREREFSWVEMNESLNIFYGEICFQLVQAVSVRNGPSPLHLPGISVPHDSYYVRLTVCSQFHR